MQDFDKDLTLVLPPIEPHERAFEPDRPKERNPWDLVKHPKQHRYIESIINKVDHDLPKPPKYSDSIKLQVFKLRDAGLTYRQIADEVKTSKSTVCLYLQNREKLETKLKKNYTVSEVDLGKIRPS